MPYATASDITTLYGPDALFVADRDGDGTADVGAVERALSSASDEIDSYIGVRETLPLTQTFPVLTQYCVDIALYRLANADNMATDEHRTRYEDAIAALRRYSKGEQRLPITIDPADTDIDGDGIPDAGPQPIVAEGPERLFTRDKLRGL